MRYGRPTKGSFVHANPQVPSLERGFVATGSFVFSWGEEEVLFEAKAVNEVDAERSPAYTSMHWQKSCKRGTWAWARALPATVEPTALSEGERRLPWGADFRGS